MTESLQSRISAVRETCRKMIEQSENGPDICSIEEQARAFATNVWTALNEALAPRVVMGEGMRDKIAVGLALVMHQRESALSRLSTPAAFKCVLIALDGLEKGRCSCRTDLVRPLKCPTCEGKLVYCTNPGWMNSEQWDSCKAGDYYCETCKGEEAKSGLKHWWEHELPSETKTCQNCEMLIAICETMEALERV